jgi:hypothetical protein
VTARELGWLLLGAALLICLGLLLGATWTTQVLQRTLRRLAEERRRLNEEWLAVRAAWRQRGRCPHCASPQSEQVWYLALTRIPEPPADG